MARVHFLLMENVTVLKNEEFLKYVFDIKGSSIDREVSGFTKNSTTLKDVNFLKIKK
jgi:hypothetical protein